MTDTINVLKLLRPPKVKWVNKMPKRIPGANRSLGVWDPYSTTVWMRNGAPLYVLIHEYIHWAIDACTMVPHAVLHYLNDKSIHVANTVSRGWLHREGKRCLTKKSS